jgi:peptide/nickel transport system permease protein
MTINVSTEVDQALGSGGVRLNSFLGRLWRLFRNYPTIPVIVLVIFFFVAVFSSFIQPRDPIQQNLRGRNAPPSWHNPGWYDDQPKLEERFFLGADHVGRDVLSRLIQGSRISLFVVAIALSTGLVAGTALGLIGGYFGGAWDEVIMRAVDIWAAVPFLLLAITVAVVLGASFTVMASLLVLLTWSGFVRNIRAEVLTIKELDYVKIALVAGASTPRILIRHIFPGVMNTMIVITTLNVGGLILAEATLSFLGAGIPGPRSTWGLMINEGRSYLSDAWWITVFPGIAIFLVVMSMNYLGDWLRDYFDPSLRQSRE